MKSFAFFAVLAGCLVAGPAQAVLVEPLADLTAAAQHYVAVQAGEGAQAQAAPLDSRLHLPVCGKTLEASAQTPNPGSAWSVAVHCAEPSAWTIYIPVRVSQHRQVVVLRHPLAPGMPVPADALAMEDRDVGALPYGYLLSLDDAAGKTLRRPLTVGAPVPPDALAAPASVHRGQDVTLVGRSNSFEVRASGKALGDAATGERVRAENLDSHRVVEGVVRDANTVEVGLQ
jgi:flagella basal body P-ring formation protein FlgA